MPKHHDRRRNDSQGAKEPRPDWGPQIGRFGASGTLTGALAPLSRPFLPQRTISRSQLAAIYESMTWSINKAERTPEMTETEGKPCPRP